MRLEPDADSAGCEAPVDRQRHRALAIWAGNGSRPQVTFDDYAAWFSGKQRPKLWFCPSYEFPGQLGVMRQQLGSMTPWPVDGCLENQGSDWVQIVGSNRKTDSAGLKRNAPPPAVGSRMVKWSRECPTVSLTHPISSTLGVCEKARLYPYGFGPRSTPPRFAASIFRRADTGSP